MITSYIFLLITFLFDSFIYDYFIHPLLPPLPPQFPLLPKRSFSMFMVFLFLCGPLSLTRVISMTVGLELSSGAPWAPQWEHNWREWLLIACHALITNSSSERGWALCPFLTYPWCQQAQSCSGTVQATTVAMGS